jgi:hypothetical protein
MLHSESSQQNAFQQQTSPQVAAALQQLAQALQQNQQTQQGGLGQGQFGQGAFGQGAFGQNTPFGTGQNWGGQRQISQQEVSNALQQIAPILPQIIAQAQQQNQGQQPLAAFGGSGYGFGQRSLSQQDVNEVVRQILPIVPQLLQQQQGYGQGGFGQQGSGWQGQAAYGINSQQNIGPFGQHQHQRQLSPQDVNEIARQLAEVIPVAYGQRM